MGRLGRQTLTEIAEDDLYDNSVYFLDGEDSLICAHCARESIDDMVEDFRPVSRHVLTVEEGEEEYEYCADCGKTLTPRQ